jgi:hypothetical protein
MLKRCSDPGSIAGLILVFCCVVTILLDIAGVTRQVEPPPFYEDFVPEKHEVCDGLPGGLARVIEADAFWSNLGWPEWPVPRGVACSADGRHLPAPEGTVRWHSCDSLRLVEGTLTPPCSTGTGGQVPGVTKVQLNEALEVIAVDIYLRTTGSRYRHRHEAGHARGFIIPPAEDVATPYVQGAHTEKPGHVMHEAAGTGAKWLDRRPDGDWPYEK